MNNESSLWLRKREKNKKMKVVKGRRQKGK